MTEQRHSPLPIGGLDSTRVEAIAASTHGFPESLTEARRSKLWSADERAVLTAAADIEDPAVRNLVSSLLPLLSGGRVDALARGADDAHQLLRSDDALAATAHTWTGHHTLAEMVLYLRAADRHHAATILDDYLTARQQVLRTEARKVRHSAGGAGSAVDSVSAPAPVSAAPAPGGSESAGSHRPQLPPWVTPATPADPDALSDEPCTPRAVTGTDGHPAARAAATLTPTTSATVAIPAAGKAP